MKDFTIDKNQIELLNEIANFQSVEIVWDINAFYINTELNTYKLMCLDEIPEGSDSTYDEVIYCKFSINKERIEFKDDDPKFWYKVVSSNCKIIGIQYINIFQLFPDTKLVPKNIAEISQNGLNKSTIGLIIKTDKGMLPAFNLPSIFGFHWQSKFDFYSQLEIDQLIAENLEYCEIINCA